MKKIFKHKTTNNQIVADENFSHLDYEFLEDRVDVVFVSTFEEKQQALIDELHVKADEEYEAYIASYAIVEGKSFDKKETQARLFLASSTEDLTYFNILTKNMTLAQKKAFADSIVAHADYMAEKELAVYEARDSIKACTTLEQLEGITI